MFRESIATRVACLGFVLSSTWAPDTLAQNCGIDKLLPVLPRERGNFGCSVSISGEHFVIDEPKTGFLYVHRRAANGWELMQRVPRPSGVEFGNATISGDRILVSARNTDPLIYRLEERSWVREGTLVSTSRSTPSYGQFASLGGRTAIVAEFGTSTAHIFYRGEDDWVEEATPKGFFAWTVAADNDRVVIGNPGDSAEIFRREQDGDSPATWVHEASLTPSDGGSSFGAGVSLRGDLALIGSSPDFSFNLGGKAYVFRRFGEEWVEEQILEQPELAPSERFARAVSIDGDLAVVGAFADSEFEGGSGFGVAYVYHFDGDEWALESQIAPEQNENDWFASSVAVEGNTVLVGAPEESSHVVASGAAYAVKIEPELRARFSVDDESFVAGQAVSFDASTSVAPAGGESPSYLWEFGDGETANGVTVEHTYARPGRYYTKLLVATTEAECEAESRMLVSCADSDLAPWVAVDVGGPTFPGSGGFVAGEALEICAGGEGLLTTREQFHFVHQEVTGDFALKVRIDELDTNGPMKVGVMLRSELTDDAAFGAVLLSFSNERTRVRFRYRQESQRSARTRSGDVIEDLPVWLEVRRQGDEVVGLSSFDGENWTEVSRSKVALAASSLIGMFLTGQDAAPTMSFAAPTVRFSAIELREIESRTPFRRGDCNEDGEVDISDASCLLNWLFLGKDNPGCVAALNANGDDAADISDATYLLNFLFLGTVAPAQPFPSCGPSDLDADKAIGCLQQPMGCP